MENNQIFNFGGSPECVQGVSVPCTKEELEILVATFKLVLKVIPPEPRNDFHFLGEILEQAGEIKKAYQGLVPYKEVLREKGSEWLIPHFDEFIAAYEIEVSFVREWVAIRQAYFWLLLNYFDLCMAKVAPPN